MISRLLAGSLASSPKSILLLGPRQVGKSTLIQSLKPDLIINLSDDKTFLEFKSDPNELNERLGARFHRTVFIDEIQRHPPLLNTIQAILDSQPVKRRTKFYLTGSSARKLRRGQANLLPGRIFAYELGPLCAAEVDYKLNVQRALKFGCLPEAYLAKDEIAEKLLSTYSGVYLKEEIQAEALTRNIDGFSRFILVAAAQNGQILDFSKLAKQAKVDRKNCARFFEILEDTLIAQRLEVYEDTGVDIKKRPKFFFFDTGVLNGLLDNFSISDDRKGALFENLVVSQVLASAKARDKRVKLSYFRTRAGYEVDLIVEIERKVFAVEIKSGRADSSDAKKLAQFSLYKKNLDGLFIVTMDTTPRRSHDVHIVDVNAFLRAIGL
jgi:predicted AAA+ superfamily ATPase